jgi:hypothetical protein
MRNSLRNSLVGLMDQGEEVPDLKSQWMAIGQTWVGIV